MISRRKVFQMAPSLAATAAGSALVALPSMSAERREALVGNLDFWIELAQRDCKLFGDDKLVNTIMLEDLKGWKELLT